MRIAILGVGGVGGYIGGKLALSKDKKDKIIFISRGKQLQKIKKDGLKLIDEDKEYIIKPDLTTDDPNDIDKFDLLIVSVKSYDLKESILALKDNISNDTVILPLLNGVDHNKEIKRFCPNAKVLNQNLDEFAWLKGLFDKAGLKNKLTSDIELETWKKYLLISAYASMTSYYQEPLGFIADKKLDELKEVLFEIKSVANAKNIEIEDKVIYKILDRIATLPYESKTSMQLDYEKNKKTELEALCGYIVKEAKKLDIDVPNMQRYYNALKISLFIVHIYANKPNHLLGQTSPYLKQHLYNPVDWYPWSKKAFLKAKKEHKMIFLSIGYSTCHWCHVMEKESFNNTNVSCDGKRVVQ